ncbi:hypothetical protein HY570_04305 [Candidatus Micrarchaeota archaeon]|nr:hypothetical protein [Candidatus Micrarchaeota archaeon]
MKEIIASAPGKILWLGAYSILENKNISYVTSVDKRVAVRVKEQKTMTLNLPQFKISVNAEFDGNELVFAKNLEEKKLREIRFVKCAVEACLKYLQEKGKKIKSFSLTTKSDKEFSVNDGKSGLGSSAAVTVASVAGVMALHGINVKKDVEVVHKLAQYAHYKAQGKVGSGFDIACATFGTCVYSRFSGDVFEKENLVEIIESDWGYNVEPLTMPAFFHVVVGNFKGESASTVDMIKKVREWKETHRSEYDRLIARINEANEEAIQYIRDMKTFDERVLKEFKKSFDLSRNLTRELGLLSGGDIQTEKFSQLIRFTFKNGAFVCKLPGAGGGDSIVAICLSNENELLVKNFWKTYNEKKIEILDVKIDNRGLEVEM